ncbi:MAG TPA: adenylate/guanylate cyclase domain-containing protein [Lacunisphaera sp.]|nr:adenylate/guanylate cyclase domain-containing protein [Lacunisphaera sp.]
MNEGTRETAASGERRLAAIVFTDVAGYSARMQRDEAGTLALVRADFAQMRARAATHGGEVLKSTGDGLLLCFSSVVQAVACAQQIQAGFAQRSPEALQHRIGIHLGDVFRESGDVVGDGVNIAARLQTKARPGAICVSQSVYDAVKGKLPMTAASLGPQRFKNIAEPMPIYEIAVDGKVRSPVVRGRRRPWPILAGLAALLGVLAVGYGLRRPGGMPATVVRSVAVLPFENLSEAQDNAFFADGVHEDLLTNLANIGAFKVISRTSVMQYRGTTKTIRQIASELGVAYVLEGSVRRAGNRVRVTGQLIRAATDEHIWAKTYDRQLTDIFATQSDLAQEIAGALQAALSPGDKERLARRPTDNLEAYDLYLKARTMLGQGGSRRETGLAARSLLEEAVRRDPNLALAWAELGRLRFDTYEFLGRDPADLAAAQAALDTADQVTPGLLEVLLARFRMARVANDIAAMGGVAAHIAANYPGRAENFATQAALARAQHRWRDAIAAGREAVALDPRGDFTLYSQWDLLTSLRLYDEGEPLVRRIAEMHPGSNIYAYSVAQHVLWASGSTKMMDEIVAAIPAADRLSKGDAISLEARTAFTEGNAEAVVRLWREAGPRWRFGTSSNRADKFTVAAALVVLGRADEARPLLESDRDRILAIVAAGGDTAAIESDLALVYALMGQGEPAHQAKARAERLPTINPLDTAQLVVVDAWLGNTAASLAELAGMLRTAPVEPRLQNVHEIRHNLLFHPLQGDPRFQALLDDPGNNAPLF